MSNAPAPRRLSRRRLIAGAGAVGLAGVGALVASELSDDAPAAAPPRASAALSFWGVHQPGIATPAQHYLHFAAFDFITDRREEIAALLQTWSAAAERMMAGDPAAALDDNPVAPPADTGEAMGLSAARLSLTFGFGPGLFSKDGVDRYGLAAKRPPALVELPGFRRDTLKPERSGGDLAVQACADDPQVAFHAVRNLARLGRGIVVMRWSQLGFNRTASTSRSQETPRNLMGFKDGTNNLRAEDQASMDQHVWVGDEGPEWMRAGAYVVTRRIRMTIEHWDRTSLDGQETTIGRSKLSGAPLTGSREPDPVDLAARDATGKPVIPMDAHIRLAGPATNDGIRMLRRGYSFTDGMDAVGELDAGLFFIAFQRDMRKQFIPVQRRLAASDALNEYITHTGSAVFACPPGASRGGWVGRGLFEDG